LDRGLGVPANLSGYGGAWKTTKTSITILDLRPKYDVGLLITQPRSSVCSVTYQVFSH